MAEFIYYDSPCLYMRTIKIIVNGKVYSFKHSRMNKGGICKDDWGSNLYDHPELEPFKEKIIKHLNMVAEFKNKKGL